MRQDPEHGFVRGKEVLALVNPNCRRLCGGCVLCLAAMTGCWKRDAPVNDILRASSVTVWGAVPENGAVLPPRTADLVKDWIVEIIHADACARGPGSREKVAFCFELVLQDGGKVEINVFFAALLTPWKKYGITSARREELELILGADREVNINE